LEASLFCCGVFIEIVINLGSARVFRLSSGQCLLSLRSNIVKAGGGARSQASLKDRIHLTIDFSPHVWDRFFDCVDALMHLPHHLWAIGRLSPSRTADSEQNQKDFHF
jgi:hypothetical protein